VETLDFGKVVSRYFYCQNLKIRIRSLHNKIDLMKKNFYKIFIWISGSDTDLLKDCAESEHKKYALQGGLVLIPTIMAFVSMSYASYILLTQNVYFCSIITMVWAGIIFIIDR
jgi:hypothetical protein